MDGVRWLFRALVAGWLAGACSGGGNAVRDGRIQAKADTVALAAGEDLSLTPSQTRQFGRAVYDLYASLEAPPFPESGSSRHPALSSRAYKDFQNRIRTLFPEGKASEILAWYYNYSNENQ